MLIIIKDIKLWDMRRIKKMHHKFRPINIEFAQMLVIMLLSIFLFLLKN